MSPAAASADNPLLGTWSLVRWEIAYGDGRPSTLPYGADAMVLANKVRGIRAAQCYDVFTAHRARLHNDAQICCLAAEGNKTQIKVIVEDFLSTEFEGGRHAPRVDMIKALEV